MSDITELNKNNIIVIPKKRKCMSSDEISALSARVEAFKKTREDMLFPIPPPIINGTPTCSECPYTITFATKSTLYKHLKDKHWLKVEANNGRPSTGGKKAANRRHYLKHRVEKKEKPRTVKQQRDAIRYQKNKWSLLLRNKVLENWQFDLLRLGGIGKMKAMKKEFNGMYYSRILKIFNGISHGLGRLLTYQNRVSVIKVLLMWLHHMVPHFIKKTYNERLVLPMLVAGDKEAPRDFVLGEEDDAFEEIVERYLNKDGEVYKIQGMLHLLEYLNWCFGRDNYDFEKVKENTFFIASLLDQPL